MPNQILSVDAQLAKCNVLSSEAEIFSYIEYGIECGLEDKQMDRSTLGGLIWLAEIDCLSSDQLCKVGKKLNKQRLTSLCDTDDNVSCDKTIKCEILTITVSEPQSCDTSKTLTISVT